MVWGAIPRNPWRTVSGAVPAYSPRHCAKGPEGISVAKETVKRYVERATPGEAVTMRGAHQADKRTILAEHFLLRHLPAEELDELLRYARVQKYAKGEVILRKWSPGSSMMAVISGRVKISSLSFDGKEIVLNILKAGETFGEIALLDGADRTADASAMEDTEVVVLERRDFMPILERHPRTCIRLLVILCGRVRHTRELIEDAVFLNIETRLAKRLIHLAERHGEERPEGILVPLKLSQREIAALIGVTRESVHKQLNAWRDKNWIKMERGSITITDREAFESLAGAGPLANAPTPRLRSRLGAVSTTAWMKCPRCNVDLKSIEPGEHGFVTLDICPDCKGAWFDEGELDDSVWVGTEQEIEMREAESDHEGLKCPSCDAMLQAISPVDASELIIDRCPNCKGFWLDDGELEKMRDFVLDGLLGHG